MKSPYDQRDASHVPFNSRQSEGAALKKRDHGPDTSSANPRLRDICSATDIEGIHLLTPGANRTLDAAAVVWSTMPRKTKDPVTPIGPPPDASLLGIPPELRNAIYRLVANGIDEVNIIGCRLPTTFRGRLKQGFARDYPIIRFNLTNNIFFSVRKLEKRWHDQNDTFTKVQYGIDVDKKYIMFDSYELNLNFKTRTMTSAQKRITPTQELLTSAMKELKKISGEVLEKFWNGNDNNRTNALLLR
ncbi:hypothetical protein MBLNU13_g07908t1 [Cladosporium sp. NU13]